jgi:hypothetical protein
MPSCTPNCLTADIPSRGDVRQGDYPCPNSPTTAFHANNIEDVTGCGLAITYKSDVTQVQPEG